MDFDSDASSDGEFSAEDFRIVRRGGPTPSKKPRQAGTDEEGGADAVAVYDVPTPTMAALSPDPPSSPVSGGDAQNQPRQGTDHEGDADAAAVHDVPTPTMAALSPDPPASTVFGDARSQPRAGADQQGPDAVDEAAPMAIESGSPEPDSPPPPPPRSESGALRQQPTSWRRALRPPQTVETIFSNFKNRRKAIIRALTEDEEAFFEQCDPGMQPLQLYGGTNGSWEVKPPELQHPAPEPEPALGINNVRDITERHKWLEAVAVYSDAWLIGISHFSAATSYMTATERGRLFDMIVSLPTIKEVLLANKDPYKKRSSGPGANAIVEEEREERSSGLDEANEEVEVEHEVYLIEEQRSSSSTLANEVIEEAEEDADDNNFCASCDSRYNTKAFWISCDICEKWYHGKCVNITSSEAEHMEHYECPDCYSERVGHDSD